MISGTATLMMVPDSASAMLDIKHMMMMSMPWVRPNTGAPALTAWDVNLHHH